MDKYIVTVESNRGEIVCITRGGRPTLVERDEARDCLEKLKAEFPKHTYRILRTTSEL